jgi:hypothetical protein
MNKNIESQLETIKTVLQAASTVVENMSDGDRMQIKKLAEAVGLSVGMEPKQVLGFVNHFAHNSAGLVYVTRGKHGGLIKGVKVVKPAKVKRVKAVVVADSVVDTTV